MTLSLLFNNLLKRAWKNGEGSEMKYIYEIFFKLHFWSERQIKLKQTRIA